MTIMQYKNTFVAFALSMLVFTSCSKSFLDKQPTDAIPEQEAFKTTAGVQTVLNGTWAYMMDTYFTYANPGYSAILRVSDAMGSDVALLTSKYGYAASYQFTDMSDKTIKRPEYFWTLLYKVIDNCNNIVAKVDQANGEATDKRYLKGQALALRAFCYLTMANFYQFNYQKDPNAKVVPIYTEPITGIVTGHAKSTEKDLYTLITTDLETADTLLVGFERDGAARYVITTDVVNGLLARAYLNMGNWQLAAQHAAAAEPNYTLMSADDYTKGFNDVQNVEWIWGHPQRPDQNTASYSFHFLDVSSPTSYYYSFMADPYFKALFDANDIRNRLFEWDTLPGREGLLRYKKFVFRADLTGDIVLMRVAEMYLIEAEALAEQGLLNDAAARLNILLQARSANPLVITTQTKDDVLQKIWIERRKELWGEGFSLSDILRTQQSVVRKAYVDGNGNPIQVSVPRGDGTFKVVTAKGHTALKFPDGSSFVPNSPYYLFAVPQAEINNNPNINN
jgi:starch-binding outer membrane protein, SusD/RagB family